MSIDWRQIGLVRRSDQIDTRRMLMIGEAARVLSAESYSLEQLAELLAVPIQGGVSAEARLREAMAVTVYWRDWHLRRAARLGASWHALVEPTRWDDVAPHEVHSYVRASLDRTNKWPSVGQTRVAFGRASNHRPAGDQPGQEQMEVGT